jgi:hypothetical protein
VPAQWDANQEFVDPKQLQKMVETFRAFMDAYKRGMVTARNDDEHALLARLGVLLTELTALRGLDKEPEA